MTAIPLTPLTPSTFGGSTTPGAPIVLGAGQEQHLFQSTTGKWIDIREGTDSAPDTSQNAPLKVNRTMSIVGATGNVLEIQSAIVGVCVGISPNEQQATGVTGIGLQESTSSDARCDALGTAGFGQVTAVGSTQAAEGLYGAARLSVSTAYAIGSEYQVQNLVRNQLSASVASVTVTIATPGVFTTKDSLGATVAHGLSAGDAVKLATSGALPTGLTAGTVYFVSTQGLSSTQFELCTTLGATPITTTGTQSGSHTVTSVGESFSEAGYSHTHGQVTDPGSVANSLYSACAYMIARSGNPAFDVGIGIPAFAASGDTMGPVLSSSFRDCAKAAYSIDIRGTHASAAISVEDGAGVVTIGRRSGNIHSSARLGIWTTPGVNASPLVEFGDPSSTAVTSLAARNSAGNWTLGLNASGIGSLTLSAGKTFLLGPSGSNFLTFDDTGKGAFYGATPVVQRGAYTQTYATATRTVNPSATSAFTGQDNTQAGTVYAKVADLNTLRTDMLAAFQAINSLIDDSQAMGMST